LKKVKKRGKSFTLTVSMGYDGNGKQIMKHTTYYPPEGVTDAKAEKLANEQWVLWKNELENKISLDENQTFAELVEWYYEMIAPIVLKSSVIPVNRRCLKNYILPTLGRVQLKNITPSMLTIMFSNLRKTGRLKQVYKLADGQKIDKDKQKAIIVNCGMIPVTLKRICEGNNVSEAYAKKIAAYLNKPFKSLFELSSNQELSAATVKRIKNIISAIFSEAVRNEIMHRNPCTYAKTPRTKKTAESFLDEQQALMLLNALDCQKDLQFKVMITLLIYTGMRAGELLGLCWPDIDIENGIIYIQNTLAYNEEDKNWNLQSAKTDSSVRYVKIPKTIVSLLLEYKTWHDERRIAMNWNDSGLVFTSSRGIYFSELYLNRKFKIFANNIGLPDGVHIHSLRHTNASLLINSDIPAKLISDQLGHSTVGITQDLYSHIFASSKARVAQVLEIKLGQK